MTDLLFLSEQTFKAKIKHKFMVDGALFIFFKPSLNMET